MNKIGADQLFDARLEEAEDVGHRDVRSCITVSAAALKDWPFMR